LTPRSPLAVQALGAALFGFIPLVLYLYVGHPEPVAVSLGLGVALMLGHRALARPYMDRVMGRKCLWCNRVLEGVPAGGGGGEAGRAPAPAPAGAGGGAPPDVERLELALGGGDRREAVCCPGHGEPAARFFAFLQRARWPLRLGIFAPLVALLAALALTALGRPAPLPAAVAAFQLTVGLTVNAAAWGYLATPARRPLESPFPVHNFYLLGVRTLLWIFRLVGIWWIARGLWFFLAR
jgi:hypothetical protein